MITVITILSSPAPGHEHFLALSAAVVSADHIRGLAAGDRRCFYSDEGNLAFYTNYTLTNCRLECAILEVERQLGCVPWYLPKVSWLRNMTLREDFSEKNVAYI